MAHSISSADPIRLLLREHSEIDAGIAGYAEGLVCGQNAAESLTHVLATLRRHIYVEEEFLFPPMYAKGLTAPVYVMLREHAELWSLLGRIERSVTEDDHRAATLALLRDLVVALASHNHKEEQMIYRRADTLLDTESRRKIARFLAAGILPSDWVAGGEASGGSERPPQRK